MTGSDVTVPAIAVEHLTVRFGDIVAVDDVTCAIDQGRVTALLGPNGAGKTTLVRTIATLMTPGDGSVLVLGTDVCDDPRAVQRAIGLAGQSAAIMPKLTGRENLRLVGSLYGLSSSAIERASDELVERHGLSSFVDQRVNTLSGGQRRRVDLAVTLVGDPDVLLLDEPTTGLDPASKRDLWETIRQLVEAGTTVLLTTQSMQEAEALADDVIVIDNGVVLTTGDLRSVRASVHTAQIEVSFDHDAERTARDAVARALDGHIVERDEHSIVIAGSFTWPDVRTALEPVGDHVTGVSLGPPPLETTLLDLTGGRS